MASNVVVPYISHGRLLFELEPLLSCHVGLVDGFDDTDLFEESKNVYLSPQLGEAFHEKLIFDASFAARGSHKSTSEEQHDILTQDAAECLVQVFLPAKAASFL